MNNIEYLNKYRPCFKYYYKELSFKYRLSKMYKNQLKILHIGKLVWCIFREDTGLFSLKHTHKLLEWNKSIAVNILREV